MVNDGTNLTHGHRLVKLANGAWSVHALAIGETCHPVIGPVAEAEALYVQQLRLRERIQGAEEFVVWDVGLGAAANAVTVIRACGEIGCRLRLISFENNLEMLRFGLRHTEKLNFLAGFEDLLTELTTRHKVSFTHLRAKVDWELHLADFPSLVASPKAQRLPRPRVILFDAYSPMKNPAMWTQSLFSAMLGLTDQAQGCLLPTYSRSTMLRVTLLMAGWYVGCGAATGEKEETTLAANRLDLLDAPLGQDWLARVWRSGGAEPMRELIYRQAPLAPETREKLIRHPQFQG